MHHTALVRISDRIADPREHVDPSGQREGVRREDLLERLPVHHLHGVEGPAFLVLPQRVHGHDARVLQLGRELGLRDKALRIVDAGLESLQRYAPG